MKKIHLFIINLFILILLEGCGYEPVYSSKNFLFKVGKIDHESNQINNQITTSLKSLSNQSAQNTLDLKLNSTKEKRIVSKSKSGDAEIFELKILVEVIINDQQKSFSSSQNYNNNENKFELNQYEIEIEKQIINGIIDDMLIYLAKF
tara:strand:+ start:799 stop:1242 length:444 start_codon:yes stop_codon:yes gene_type:complete